MRYLLAKERVYTNNDPINNTDPSGEVANFVIGAIIGAAIDGGLELASQVASGEDIDIGAIGAAAAEGAVVGAVTGGIGNIAKLGKAAGTVARISNKSSKAASTGLKNKSGNLADAAKKARTNPHPRKVSVHANQRLKTRDKKLTPDTMEAAATKGQKNFDPKTGKTVNNLPASQSPSGRGATVVTNPKGDVVTVIDKGSKFEPKL